MEVKTILKICTALEVYFKNVKNKDVTVYVTIFDDGSGSFMYSGNSGNNEDIFSFHNLEDMNTSFLEWIVENVKP
jgi:hypothetical protein